MTLNKFITVNYLMMAYCEGSFINYFTKNGNIKSNTLFNSIETNGINMKSKSICNENINRFILLSNKSFYSNLSMLKVKGRGFKIYSYNNSSYLRLGYSHLHFLYFFPGMHLKKKPKKKQFYKFYSNFFFPMSFLLKKINNLRIPDVYTRKGVYYQRKSL